MTDRSFLVFFIDRHGVLWGKPRVLGARDAEEALRQAYPIPPSRKDVDQASVWELAHPPRHTAFPIKVHAPEYGPGKPFNPTGAIHDHDVR